MSICSNRLMWGVDVGVDPMTKAQDQVRDYEIHTEYTQRGLVHIHPTWITITVQHGHFTTAPPARTPHCRTGKAVTVRDLNCCKNPHVSANLRYRRISMIRRVSGWMDVHQSSLCVVFKAVPKRLKHLASGQNWFTVRPCEGWEYNYNFLVYSFNLFSPLFSPNSNTKACAIEALTTRLMYCLYLAWAVLPAIPPTPAHWTNSFVNHTLPNRKNANKFVTAKIYFAISQVKIPQRTLGPF